jgi:flavodoxin
VKTLVIYYTRSGNTRKAAEEIAAALGADIELLRDGVNRGGPIGFIKSGREARSGATVDLKPLEHDPSTYDLVVVGTPVWARMVSSPVKTFLRTVPTGSAKLAWFCTVGASSESFKDNCFTTMTEAAGRNPMAMIGLSSRELKNDHSSAVAGFVESLKAAGTKG